MFTFSRPRPPIIIINEAEHKEPEPVIQEKSLWSKYAGPVYFVSVLFHFIAFIVLLAMLNGIKEHAEQANAVLQRQLNVTDSLYNAIVLAHFYDSVAAAKHFAVADSSNSASFKALSLQLDEMNKTHLLWQKKYEQAAAIDTIR